MGKLYFILNDKLGAGDPELGTLLMEKYIYSLARAEQAPEKLVFMNAGVNLTCEGSKALDDLRLLADRGVTISSCGTCLDFYHKREQLAVGVAGNMDGSVASMLSADDVVVLR